MKKLSFLALLAIASFASTANAQTSAATTTNAGAVLLKAMTLSQTAPLHFGSNVLVTNAGGTVVLPSNSSTRTYTGGVATSAATPTATNAAYNVTGTALETYALTLPTTTTVTHTTVASGVYQMDITDMKARFNGAGSDAVTSTLSSSGTDSFTLGGTLTVQASQIGGVYAGTFNVSIDYN
ncbi:hypothetical protein FFWV33_02510 [Flavobacterium faecale]|uniref:DUF4402 domain-containing protein n=1 Tax=Flavobacterium faecale TaxID=1355330 RepID=A0A2S1L9N3_9FLAO|nr:DUF4402 domain-containing protein [Flavobacterium faecale]AWG20480.1 hypothetical protein FFWV33_02510 [Flavobacterium faecale]